MKAWGNPLAFLEVDGPLAPNDPPVPAPETVLAFLCPTGTASDVPSLVKRYKEIGARRQLLLPVDDNYFCRRRVSKRSPLATAAELGHCRWPVAGRV
jgi:hypothetical protein